jgi:P27 family predicted phage terminase small subunit
VENMAGRRPKSTIDRKLGGNAGKRPYNRREPVVRVGLPAPPDHLDQGAKDHWIQFGAELVKEQRIGVVYGPIFASYCVAWSRWVQAERRVSLDGAVQVTPNGFEVKSAWLSIADRAWSQVVKSLGELGLTPTAQSRAVRVDNVEKEQDPFAEFDKTSPGLSPRVN